MRRMYYHGAVAQKESSCGSLQTLVALVLLGTFGAPYSFEERNPRVLAWNCKIRSKSRPVPGVQLKPECPKPRNPRHQIPKALNPANQAGECSARFNLSLRASAGFVQGLGHGEEERLPYGSHPF